jgi:hypothetical protein
MAKQPWVSIDAGFVPVEQRPCNWQEAKESPCGTCQTAPCCTYLPLHTFRVDTMFELDHARYLLNFDRIEPGLTANGDWGVYYRYPCRHLERDKFPCRVHDSSLPPHIFCNYNPDTCWHRKVLPSPTSDTYLRVDRPRLELIIDNCVFDDEHNIIEVPEWGASQEAFAEMPGERQVDAEQEQGEDSTFETWLRMTGRGTVNPASKSIRKLNDLHNPCKSCVAYCCRTLVFPHGTPGSYSNLDYLSFCLGFPCVELLISDFDWWLAVKTRCRHLEGSRCSLYEGLQVCGRRQTFQSDES